MIEDLRKFGRNVVHFHVRVSFYNSIQFNSLFILHYKQRLHRVIFGHKN